MPIQTGVGRTLGTLVALLAGAVPVMAQDAPTPARTPVTQLPVPGAPGGTRLFFGPSGRMLEPGRGYFSFDLPALLSVNVGVTPWFSLGGGFLPVVGEQGSPPPYWVIPKVRIFARDQTSVALCVAHAVVARDTRVGLAYLVGTRGTDDRSLSLGGALAYVVDRNDAGEDHNGYGGALLVGGTNRLSPKWTLVTENYLTTEGGFLTLGFRLDRRSFMANFVGVALFDFGDGVFVFPAASFGWKF